MASPNDPNSDLEMASPNDPNSDLEIASPNDPNSDNINRHAYAEGAGVDLTGIHA